MPDAGQAVNVDCNGRQTGRVSFPFVLRDAFFRNSHTASFLSLTDQEGNESPFERARQSTRKPGEEGFEPVDQR